jgi:hypothetical protein
VVRQVGPPIEALAMIRIFGRALVSRTSTVIIDLVVIAMMALSLIELVREFAAGPVQANAREIITNVSVIMIGWGVALE